MNNELKFNEKLIQFLYSIGLPPQRLLQGLICLLVLGVIVAALFFLNFDSFGGGSNQANNVASTDPTKNKVLTTEVDLDKQIDELTFFDASQYGYIVLYGEVQKQMDLIAEFRQRENISPGQLRKLDDIQLRNLQVVAVRSMRAGISSDAEMKSFVDFAESLSNSDDEKQRDTAGFLLVRTAAIAFSLAPTEANAKTAIETIKSRRKTLVNEPKRSESILGIFLKFRNNNPANKFVNQCIETLGDTLDSSTEPTVQKLAATIREFGLFSDIQMSTIENRIRYKENSGLEDLDKVLRVIEANPDVTIGIWELVIQSYESSLSIGQLDNFSTARKIVGDLVAKLPDSDPRKAQLSEALDRQGKRAGNMGASFDLSGDTVDGRTIAGSANGFSLLCFLDRSEVSAQVMSELTQRLSEGIAFRPILAFKDDFTEQDIEKANEIPSKFYAADRKTALRYMESFPCDNFPYMLLIDESGVVVSVNPNLLQALNRIASLQKAAR